MLSPTLLLPLLATFALASPTPGEVNPATREPAPGEPTWYCTYRHRIILLDYFTLEGQNWNVLEKDLKASIGEHGGAISNWFFRDSWTSDGQQSFIAHVSFRIFNFFWGFFLGGGRGFLSRLFKLTCSPLLYGPRKIWQASRQSSC